MAKKPVFKNLAELNQFHVRKSVEIFAASFFEPLSFISSNVDTIADILEHSFVPSNHYVAILDGNVVSVVSYSTAQSRSHQFHHDQLVRSWALCEVLSPSPDYVVYSNDLLISKNRNVTSIRLPPTPHLEAWASQPNYSGSSCASCRIGNSYSRWLKPILERFASTRSWDSRSPNEKRNDRFGSRTRRVESLLCVNR